MKRAVLYVRVSSKEQAAGGYSIEGQHEIGVKYIAEHGWELVEAFPERGESARTAKRPEYKRMLSFLEADGAIDYVVIYKLDRIIRNLEDYADLRGYLRARGVRLISMMEGFDDSPAGRMMEGILAAVAEWFSGNLGEGVKMGMNQKVLTGWWPHQAPIGYRNVRRDGARKDEGQIEADPIQKGYAREAFELYATGTWTLKNLLRTLTDKGLRNSQGKPPSSTQFHKMLSNPFYTGVMVWKGVEFPGNHEAIIDPEVFQRVQDVLHVHAAAGSRYRVKEHYLRGSLFCASCGARYSDGTSRGRGGTYHHYFFCLGRQTHRNGCQAPYVAAEELEKQVELLWFRLEVPQWLRKKIKADLAKRIPDRLAEREHQYSAGLRRLEELEQERRRLRDAYLTGALPIELLKESQDRIAEEIRQLESRVPAKDPSDEVERMLDRAFGYADRFRDAYLAAEPQERRAWNQHVFKGFWVGDREIKRSEFQDFWNYLVKYESGGSSIDKLVAPAGFEPAISALRGLRPRPLDDGAAIWWAALGLNQ